jgi:hypothetical protein
LDEEARKMRSYRIPDTDLNLFLIALEMNFGIKELFQKPKYIFKVENAYDVVLEEVGYHSDLAIKKFIKALWTQQLRNSLIGADGDHLDSIDKHKSHPV